MFASKITLLALLAIFASASGQSFSHSGMGTAYSGPHQMDATGQNMCEINPSSLDDQWQVYYGAMNQADWDKAGGKGGIDGKGGICGKCIAVRGVPGQTTSGFNIKTVVVKIVDQCPDWACDPGNVDFSTTALEAITGYSWDKKAITWDFVDCNSNPDADAAKAAAAKAAAAKAAAAKAAAAKAAATAAKIQADVNAATSSIVSEAGTALDQASQISEQATAGTATLATVAQDVSVEASQALDAQSIMQTAVRRRSRRAL